jgi:hypothetical protein
MRVPEIADFEIEAEFLCREDGEDVTEDLGPLVESMPESLELLALRHSRLDQIEVLFQGLGRGDRWS